MAKAKPALSEGRQEELLGELAHVAKQRLLTISDAKDLREEEEARHQSILLEIRKMQRDANRALVAAIDDLAGKGVPKGVIYKRIGLTAQRLGQIRRAVAEWDNGARKGDEKK